MKSYAEWFANSSGHMPHKWQSDLATEPVCKNRLIRIPTGMGKTLGVLGAWIYNRLIRQEDSWPRRLVWCLPMRVLTEQTAAVARGALDRAGLKDVQVHVLMGGEDAGEWHLYPEREAVLVGTQDMLLSRALNRGYACGRARWPMEYALLNQDALWVFDEVQLMDVGLITSAQLQAFREQDGDKLLRPCHSWWMSATLQPDWLRTVDSDTVIDAAREAGLSIPREERTGGPWKVEKEVNLESVPVKDDTAMAELVLAAHRRQATGQNGRITLAICNTVDRASGLFAKLKMAAADDQDLRLIHSRFRGKEKAVWADQFLGKEHCTADADRIIVATQVVEAGVDISAGVLVSELAPWPSLVQRIGRCARYGGSGRVVIVNREFDDKTSLPYEIGELTAARAALDELNGAGITALQEFEERMAAAQREALYPYSYLHLITRQEADELFDTSPDLSGADTDISRFIRSDDQRDVSVFWAEVADDDPPPELQPLRQGLCSIPVGKVDKWLFKNGRLKENHRAWYWDYVDSRWYRLRPGYTYPGLSLLVSDDTGGYNPETGFTGKRKKKETVETAGTYRTAADLTDLAQPRDDRSKEPWKTIAFHGHEVGQEVRRILTGLGLDEHLGETLHRAAVVHDWGKRHPAFAGAISAEGPGAPDADDLAKAPAEAWVDWRHVYCQSNEYGPRKGFRHELTSTIACLEYLRRRDARHPALLGNLQEWIEAGVLDEPPAEESPPDDPLGLLPMDEQTVNLLLYVVCSHHGKVRGAWQATPHDQAFPEHGDYVGDGMPLFGVREGDRVPGCRLMPADEPETMPEVVLHLDAAAVGLSARYGRSWNERVTALKAALGPLTLAYAEALFRAADCRASRLQTTDPILEGDRQ